MRKLFFVIGFLIPFFCNAQTPVFACGFECQTNAVTGPHWGIFPTRSTTTVRSGSGAGQTNPTATTEYYSANLNPGSVMVVRVYVRFATLPDVNTEIAVDGTSKGGAWFKASDSKIYAGSRLSVTPVFGSTGVSVTTGQWYKIDVKNNRSVSDHAIVDVKVDGTDCGQNDETVGGAGTGTNNEIVLGSDIINVTMDVFFDDLIISKTSGDYPISGGYVNHFVPTSDGTHNIAGAADFKRGASGTDITNSTTDSYLLIDDVPISSSVVTDDYINAIAPPNATDYTENKFGPASGISTPTTGPRLVTIMVATHQAATQSGSYKLNLNDNGTMSLINEQVGVNGVTTLQYARVELATAPSTSAAWTSTLFNNLRVRFYSADASPDQYFDCALIEAEFEEQNNTVPGTPSDKRHTLLGVGVAYNKPYYYKQSKP